jgi:hypothetical protein
MKYYVYITSGGAPVYLYEGRSATQAKYYTEAAVSIMKYVKGTGTIRYRNEDSEGVRYFKEGEE